MQAFPSPDLIIYNAGTDVLAGDPLGRMAVSREGIVERDELVWRYALQTAGAPLVMTLSGGYAKDSAAVITESLTNIMTKFGLNGKGGAAGDGSVGAVAAATATAAGTDVEA